MGRYILEVQKISNVEEDHITFDIYEKLEEALDMNGGSVNCRYIESYERVQGIERKKIGYYTNKYEFKENDWYIFFEIKEDTVPLIMETAISLTKEFPANYSLQYREFIRRLSIQKAITPYQ